MATMEAIYWALRELQGLGYAWSPDGDNWRLTPSGSEAAESYLQSLPTADLVLILLNFNDLDDEA